MPFRFRLQVLLSLRASLEKHAESALQRSQAEVAQTVHNIAEKDQAIADARSDWQDLLRRSATGFQLSSMLEAENSLRLEKAGLEETLAQLIIDRDEQMRRYQQAHREHEVLLDIRKQRMAVYQQQQVWAQQKLLDDIVMTRWPRC
jgi:flagellar export protein FliJ